MAEENKKKRKRKGAEITNGPNYGNRSEKQKFHPDVNTSKETDNIRAWEIDYEDLEDMWYEIEKDYRERYPQLTDGDVNVEPAHFERTIERIGERINKNTEDIILEIENWL